MTTELATVPPGNAMAQHHRAATDAAGVCRELVVKTAATIGGRKYIPVEGWQAIANAFGCVASARDVRRVEGGFAATGVVRRVVDGVELATAEGFVGDDETTWAKRPEFARRAMAQTRAMSRACRSAFAFVVAAMDAGLETTPAEEMSHVVDEHDAAPPARRTRAARAPAATVDHTPLEKARLAITRATSLDDLDRLRRLVAERGGDGTFVADDVADLERLIHGRAELLIGSDERGA